MGRTRLDVERSFLVWIFAVAQFLAALERKGQGGRPGFGFFPEGEITADGLIVSRRAGESGGGLVRRLRIELE